MFVQKNVNLFANVYLWLIFTTRKQSLGQGNIFRSVCQSLCPWKGGVSVWCHFLSGCMVPCSFLGYLSLIPFSFLGCPYLGGGSSVQGVSVRRPPKSEKWAVSILLDCFLFIQTSTHVFSIFSVSIFALIAVTFLKGQVKKNIIVWSSDQLKLKFSSLCDSYPSDK